MPVLKHAKKKLRQDKGRTLDNLRIKKLYKKLMKEARETGSPEAVSKAFQAIDKAAKKYVIHKNKAARLKSSLTKKSNGELTKADVAKKKTASAKKSSASKAAKAKIAKTAAKKASAKK
jgi:small subunit ribosomal protein S20